jgi:hypothetical protein
MEKAMNDSDAVMLSPQIVGQLEKRHEAILEKVLAGTSLDDKQWITVQVALGAAGGIGRNDLVGRVSGLAALNPAVIETAIAGLVSASLVEEVSGAAHLLVVTPQGRELVSALRAKVQGLIGPAYGSVSPEDLATAGRVVVAITNRLSEVLASF